MFQNRTFPAELVLAGGVADLPLMKETTSEPTRFACLHPTQLPQLPIHTARYRQRCHFDGHFARAKVPLRAEMEGENKYSPPFGTTHGMGRRSGVLWLLGFVPSIVRNAGSETWPMMGSKPGVMFVGLKGGKLGVFDQPNQS